MAAESSPAATGRSDGGVTAESYIGSLISLTSKSEIRYEGVLYNINTEESSIGLRNVRSFGTEGRKKDGPQVSPSDKIYEYILFRGSDIKDLQVKASPTVQSSPPINNDPAIIQSHYPHSTIPSTNLHAASSGSLGDQVSHSTQMGLPGSTFQSGLALYQPSGNLNSWGPSQPNANGASVAMPMYWQGFYGTPNGLPQMPQQSLLPQPPGLSVPSLQQMQYSGFSSSLPTAAQSLPASNLRDHQISLVASSTSSSTLNSTLPSSTLSFNAPSLQPGCVESGTLINQPQNKAPISGLPTPTPVPSLPYSAPLSTMVPDNAGGSSIASKLNPLLGPPALSQQKILQPGTSSGTITSVRKETLTPPLVTPGQLLQSGPATTVSSSQPLQSGHEDVEVVQVSPKRPPEPSGTVATEAQPPILLLPPNSRAYKPNGTNYHMRNNYRRCGGRGYGVSRPVAKFTEDFDFTAMNEKFNKDKVWGHLGKKSQSKDKDGNENASYEEDSQDEDEYEQPEIEVKPVYNKDDFFDSLSCNALDTDPNRGRTRYSEQVRLDTETFGDFSRYRGGHGGRGYNRGGRFRRSYHGRGYGGYGYGNRGRSGGRGTQNRA